MIRITDMAFRKSTGTLNVLQSISCILSSGVLAYTAGFNWAAAIVYITLICELTGMLMATVVKKIPDIVSDNMNDDEYELFMGMSRLIMVLHIFLMALNAAINFVLGIGVSVYVLWVM